VPALLGWTYAGELLLRASADDAGDEDLRNAGSFNAVYMKRIARKAARPPIAMR
jgi:hypothetical protein